MASEGEPKTSRAQKGYSSIGGGKATRRTGWCHHDDDALKEAELPRFLRDLKEHQLALFNQDEHVAVAHDKSLVVLRFDDLARARDGSSTRELKPVSQAKAESPITHIATRGSRRPLEIIAATADGCVWTYNFEYKGPRRSYISIAKRPSVRLMAKGIKGEIRAILPTRKRIIVQTKAAANSRSILYELDGRSARLVRAVAVPLDDPGSLVSLDTRRTDVLIGVNSGGETRLVSLPESTAAAEAEVTSLDMPRVSAATLLNNRYLVVAQKGGQITKLDVSIAAPTAITPQHDPWARACKILCELMRRCGCLKPCKSSDPDRPTPGGGTPPGGIVDDEPCDDRHRSKLQWTPRTLTTIGTQLVAYSAGNRRMAVFDQRLNLVFERYLGRAGAIIAAGQSNTQRMLIYHPHKQQLEAWSLADYIDTLPGLLQDDFVLPPLRPASKVTYYGQRRANASPNPDLKVCVFTVVEPGQAFTDANQNKLLAQIEPEVFDIVNDYYDENSYDELDVQFSVFGADFGGMRTPLVLPQAIADYFYEQFTPGGVQAIMPADWTDPVVLDGTESLELHTNPRVGDGKDYVVPFAALWTTETHASYPVDVDFDGTETLQLTVEDQQGDTHVLNLNFGALSLSHDQGEDEDAFLAALGNHVTNAIRAAESTLPGNPLTMQDVVFRRIRANDDDSQFGRLQGQFRVAPPGDPADFAQKGTIAISSVPTPTPAAIDALGLTGLGSRDGVLGRNETDSFLRECLDAARKDAGEGPGLNDPHFNNSVSSTEDAAAMELAVLITLTSAKGGQGASIEVTGQSGLLGTGWPTATPVPGSESTANNTSTLRDSAQLADDVFTAALDHIRATTVWNADEVRDMFVDFDVMMIGFVGQPPPGVPAADQWGAADPNDFGRLRMFRRAHIATDRNNPGPGTPVTMNTSVVIGQTFNTFQPGVMAHELGHALGLPDLYSASGFRDDVLYIDSWAMMGGGNSNFNHFCGWSKWALGWIVEDSNDDVNRVVDVPLPDPAGTSTTESWLVPVEYWDASMKNDVRAEVGGTLRIAQLMKINLGSDGGVINFLELRAPAMTYSQNLPPSPAVIATNVLDPNTDRRWAVNGLYRRSVHRLNNGGELRNVGDTWDFAAGVEFPLKGCTAEVVDTATIRGGTIPVFRVKVEREAADYIDLFFQDNVPSWRSPDIWVDWPGDNPDPDVPRVYPEGTPTDQGETVRFPSSGIEKHYLVARVHNAGTARAEDVKVRWFVSDPPGSGDDGRWVQKDTQTISEVGDGDSEIMPFNWNVDSSTNSHQCIRAEIIDWTIPSEVDPATGDTLHLASDDVKLQNNNAQQNVFDFEALTSSPYDPVEFAFQVHNDYVESETAVLVPDRLPWGATLEVSPAEARIAPGKNQVFRCTLALDDQIIRPGCNNDEGFLLTAWRRAEDSDEKWGSCFYFIRPRFKTELIIKSGYWIHTRVTANGRLGVITDEPFDLSGQSPLHVRVRIEVDLGGSAAKTFWDTVPVNAIGQFTLDRRDDIFAKGALVTLQAWFDRTDLLGSSVSEPLELKQPVIQ